MSDGEIKGKPVTWMCHRRVCPQLRFETTDRSSLQFLSTPYMPPKASTSKRPVSTRAAKATKKAEDVEDLTRQLASKLTISKPKEKQRVTPGSPPQDNPNTSMRTVNTASQKLSALMQTGWTATKDSGVSKQRQEAVTCARNIKKNLNTLRKAMASSPLDLERAALSAVGKLLAIQLVCPHHLSLCTPIHSSRYSLNTPWIYCSTCTTPYSRVTLTALIPRTRRYHRHILLADFSPGNTCSTFPFPLPLPTRSP